MILLLVKYKFTDKTAFVKITIVIANNKQLRRIFANFYINISYKVLFINKFCLLVETHVSHWLTAVFQFKLRIFRVHLLFRFVQKNE